MPRCGSDFPRDSALNWGLWRERGTVLTSARHSTRWASRIARNASSDRLECPTVKTVSGMPLQDTAVGGGSDNEKGGRGEHLIPLPRDPGAARLVPDAR